MPVSAVVADADVLGVLQPGTHGSTFGGNPLACAVGRAVVDLLATGDYQRRATTLGARMRERLNGMLGRGVVGVRSRGLWAGVDIDPALGSGRDLCEALARRRVLAKDTHGSTIRLAPPIVITEAAAGPRSGPARELRPRPDLRLTEPRVGNLSGRAGEGRGRVA